MSGGMDLLAIAQSYVDRMVDVPGMKALLLDAETTVSLSGIATQTYIQNHEVFLVEKLEANKTDKLPHLKAIVWVRPTRENVARLRRELKDPRFGAYHIFFANRAEDLRLQDLAEADTREVVHAVQECFCDFVVLDQDHFDVPVPRPHVLLQPAEWEYGAAMDAVQRGTEGLASLALALRRRFTIRCAAGSEAGARLGGGLQHLAAAEERELFDFGVRGGGGNPVLLLLDRADDPVTPLLTQWTYRAMTHELLGIHDGCVDLASAAAAGAGHGGSPPTAVRPEYATAVLTPAADEFFTTHAGRNYGEVGLAVKGLVDELAGAQRAGGELGSLEAMSAFVEGLGGLGASQGVAYKHVTLMGELGGAVERRSLMTLSSLEQDIVCGPAALAAHAQAVTAAVGDPAHAPSDWLRLAALFALRYERDGAPQIATLVAKLRAAGVPERRAGVIKTLLERCGVGRRVGDLFQDRTLTSRFAVLAKQHIKGVENVYTQHAPLLTQVLERLAKGKLPESEYPFVDRASSSVNGPAAPPPRLIVAFILGGSTYEEAAAVTALNAAAARGEGPLPPGTRVLLGGTGVLNSDAFLDSLMAVGEAKPAGATHGMR